MNLAALLVGLVLTPAVAGWTEYVLINMLCTFDPLPPSLG